MPNATNVAAITLPGTDARVAASVAAGITTWADTTTSPTAPTSFSSTSHAEPVPSPSPSAASVSLLCWLAQRTDAKRYPASSASRTNPTGCDSRPPTVNMSPGRDQGTVSNTRRTPDPSWIPSLAVDDLGIEPQRCDEACKAQDQAGVGNDRSHRVAQSQARGSLDCREDGHCSLRRCRAEADDRSADDHRRDAQALRELDRLIYKNIRGLAQGEERNSDAS